MMRWWQFILDVRKPEERRPWRISYDSLGIAGTKVYILGVFIILAVTIYIAFGLQFAGVAVLDALIPTIGGMFIGVFAMAGVVTTIGVIIIGIGWDLGKLIGVAVRKLVDRL